MLVFTNGCFDILHVGHIRYLQVSKALGTKLVVGLNSDASVRRIKGPDRPINSQEDRAEVLRALACVDEVVIFDEDTPYELIKSLRPDVITKGGDYEADDVVGIDLARVVIFPYIAEKSTTRIIEDARQKGLGARGNLCLDGDILWETSVLRAGQEVLNAFPQRQGRDVVRPAGRFRSDDY
jgi:D-beta-D-heptose 7-phosphate kinase/D-beta-D-heptose 1-phosphate adenosyltransferase